MDEVCSVAGALLYPRSMSSMQDVVKREGLGTVESVRAQKGVLRNAGQYLCGNHEGRRDSDCC